MGLDCASLKFPCAAKSIGVNFERTMMVGRQLFNAKQSTIDQVLTVLHPAMTPQRSCGGAFRSTYPLTAPELFLETMRSGNATFGEPFFKLLGASEVSSIDASSYEEATYLHDMNLPLPATLAQRFSVVHDGGTIEHVFNIPQALKNCMEMVALGGHFTQVNVCNNFCGHGFWQFSPEMLYRVFTPENGFRIKAMLLHELRPNGGWYAVEDPQTTGHRAELCNSTPTYILTIAERTELKDIFSKAPQQSDYVSVWTGRKKQADTAVTAPTHGWRGLIRTAARRLLPLRIRSALRSLFDGKAPAFKATYYRRIHEDELLNGHGLVSSSHDMLS
jgi:hypothetical protein